jgi:hypothetical protein
VHITATNDRKTDQFMKRIFGLTLALASLFLASSAVAATLKDGTILYSAGYYLGGQPIPVGVDSYGYNYQAKMFSGSYFNAYANSANLPAYSGDDAAYVLANPAASSHWAWPYRNDRLSMKWNDAWLSNQDSDNDGKLDRHLGLPSYIGSGAWVNNHMAGEYDNGGIEESWNYYVKIVAAPSTATVVSGKWVNDKGVEIGNVIWGEFAETQVIYNDTGTGEHGVQYRSPAGPGYGNIK